LRDEEEGYYVYGACGIAYGGMGAMQLLVKKLGLDEAINHRLRLFKLRNPYFESDHVLNIAYNILCDGDCLEDIEKLRNDENYLDAVGAERIPDPTTAGDFCRRFSTEQVERLQDIINGIRLKVWAQQDPAFFKEAVIDADGTIAPTTGECKDGMDISYKGIWGYAPLIISLANTKEVLYVVNRPGNAPSHTDAAVWIDKAIAHVQPHAPRVCVRGDTDFSLTANFDRWSTHVDFLFGMDCSQALRCRADAVEESCWQRLQRPPKYETLTEQTRERFQPHEKKRIVREREYVNLERLDDRLADRGSIWLPVAIPGKRSSDRRSPESAGAILLSAGHRRRVGFRSFQLACGTRCSHERICEPRRVGIGHRSVGESEPHSLRRTGPTAVGRCSGGRRWAGRVSE